MKINMNQEIKSYTGEAFVTGQKLEICPHCNGSLPQLDGNSGEPLTLKLLCARTLANLNEADSKKLSGDDKADRGLLAIRIFDTADEIDLKIEDLVLLKQCVGSSTYNPVVIARAFEMLDPS